MSTINNEHARQYEFSFVDGSGFAEPVKHKVTLHEGVTHDEVVWNFMGFMSEVYGYEVAEAMGIKF